MPQPVVSRRYLFLCSPPKMVLALRPDSRATLRKLTPRSFEGAAGDSKVSHAARNSTLGRPGRASARIFSNGKTIAERLNDLRKARREEDKSKGTILALNHTKIPRHPL